MDLSKGSDSDCMPVVVLQNCEPELSYILDELFKMSLKETYFRVVGRSCLWFLYLKMLGRGLHIKTTAKLVFFLSLVESLKNL